MVVFVSVPLWLGLAILALGFTLWFARYLIDSGHSHLMVSALALIVLFPLALTPAQMFLHLWPREAPQWAKTLAILFVMAITIPGILAPVIVKNWRPGGGRLAIRDRRDAP